MPHQALTRRRLSQGFAAVVGAAATGSTSVFASAHHTLKLGDAEIIVLSDGHLTLTPRNLAATVPDAQLHVAAKTTDTVNVPTNVTLVRTGKDVILIDVGAGPNFMGTAGKLADSLAAAKIDPASVTKVVFTHGHPDHLWGVIDEFDNSPRFPNARYVMSEAEWALWMSGDPLSKVPANRQNFVPGAVRNLQAIKDRITFVKPGQEVGPGLTAIDTSGHTQGHISIQIASGRETLVVLGDALTHPVISFEHPEWRPEADHDPERAVATRKALLDRLATEKTRILGFHLPFPGLGQVERRGAGYVYRVA
ncbi:MAG: MBL fold metallo-hydrolase [Hyphomicrobiaceae bacterium]